MTRVRHALMTAMNSIDWNKLPLRPVVNRALLVAYKLAASVLHDVERKIELTTGGTVWGIFVSVVVIAASVVVVRRLYFLRRPQLVDAAHAVEVPQPECRSRNTTYCEICMDDEPTDHMIFINRCSHAYCRTGLHRYVVDRINQQDVTPDCPHDGCNAKLSDPELCRLLRLKS